ncbi:hypothetical protein PUN28_001301 [Cardiocondyla obscurior]|uniref:Uncharacterized protein n=2 Tax=Cardiocondyla obscurior TaxID=286306 RepID=A0AAW2H4B9_9HYME
MYISVNCFAASWLLLCLAVPFYTRAEKPDWITYEIDVPVHQFRPIQSKTISTKEQFRINTPKSSQYNVHHSKSSLAHPTKNRHPQNNVKLNAARFMPEYQLEEAYRPHSQYVKNRETEEENATRLKRKELRDRNEEIMKKMNLLDKVLSEDTDENDVERNTVEDEIVAEMKMSEETKRVVRQVRKRRPGFFWTLARLTFETFNDTRSAIKQISSFINQTIEPETTTRRSASSNSLTIANTTTIAPASEQNNTSSDVGGVNATMTTTTTTEAPFRFTTTNLQNLVLRNLRGLVRLFNIEWQDALNQSEITVREFQKNLGNQVGSYLQDNPNAF